MKKKVVTFGEVMMRLSPPGHSTFAQATSLDMTFGGGEANVAISLAHFGENAVHVTRFPDTVQGKVATQFLRHHWVDTSQIIYGDQNIGIYFLEKGAIHRPSQVTYQRAGSSFAKISPEMINWREILKGADWFHWTGITPAVSQGAADCCLEAIKVANEFNIIVSGDIHSRRSLWNYGKEPTEVMPNLIEGSDMVIAGSFDISKNLRGEEGNSSEDFSRSAQKLMKAFPRIKKVVDKDRESISASHNRITGKLWDGKREIRSSELDVSPIVDRVGTGDAYAAGLIYGLLNLNSDKEALEFATAACALKHSVEGDVNLVSQEQVLNLMGGDTSGRIDR